MTVYLYTALIELDRKLIKLVTGIFFILDLLLYLIHSEQLLFARKSYSRSHNSMLAVSPLVYSWKRMLAV